VRRVVNILGDATAEELGSAPTADDNVAEEMIIFRVSVRLTHLALTSTNLFKVPIPDEGHQLRDSIAFTVRNTINFMADFFDPNGLFASPLPLAPTPAQREDQAYINRIAQYNRGVIVFHEVRTDSGQSLSPPSLLAINN
jgi:hypothetical protein